jgi:signal transduction histidine kinase
MSSTLHIRCFIRNDTDRRVREEILLVSNRIMKKEAEAKSTFIRHVFHEMRTPLHVLSNFLGIMSPSPEDFDEMRHHTGEGQS